MDSYNMKEADFYELGSDYYQFNSTESDNSTNENIDWNESLFGERPRTRSAITFSSFSAA